MDLSKLKWPIIIIVVVGLGWLMTSPGVNFLFKKYTEAEVGADPEQDKRDEAGLTKLSGYLIKTFQYEKATEVIEKAIERYSDGEDSYYNYYRLVKCYEKAERYQEASDILGMLIQWNSSEHDNRVPIDNNLKLRRTKLIEIHELNS